MLLYKRTLTVLRRQGAGLNTPKNRHCSKEVGFLLTFSNGSAVLKQPILPTGGASHGTRRIPPRPHRRHYSYRRPSVTRLRSPVAQLPPPTLPTVRPLLLP